MFIKPLKFIGLMLLGLICLMVQASASLAFDTTRITGYSEIYGDINVEVKAAGQWLKDASVNQQDFIHYHTLGVSSYIWDPRLMQFDVRGSFYQDYMRRDVDSEDYIRYGGSGAITFFPSSFLPLTIRGSREQSINPQLDVTEGGADILFKKGKWPIIALTGNWVNFKSDEKGFHQDTNYLTGSARFVYEIFIKPIRMKAKRTEENGNEGNGNGNGKNGKNGKKEEEPGGGRLLIDISYDYFRTEDKITDIFTQQQRGVIFLGYFFNNARSFIINNTIWNRYGDIDNYSDTLTYFNQWSPTFSYNLGGFYNYTTRYFVDKIVTEDTQSAGAFVNLSKIFSPAWRATLNASGHFSSNVLKETSWGASGNGSIFSRVFPNFDWSASIGGGVANDIQHNYTSSYNAGLSGLYRLTANKILTAEGTFIYLSGLNGTHGWEGRGRLTFDSVWSPDFTLRGIAEYRYQDYSELQLSIQNNTVINGKNQTGSADVYGLYRLTPRTSLYAGANFTYNNFDSTIDKYARVYASLSSSLWDNLNFSLSAGYDYAIDRKQWSARVSPQISYVWRQIYFSLWGEFIYMGANNHNNNQWNYYVNFRVSRPFSIKFL